MQQQQQQNDEQLNLLIGSQLVYSSPAPHQRQIPRDVTMTPRHSAAQSAHPYGNLKFKRTTRGAPKVYKTPEYEIIEIGDSSSDDDDGADNNKDIDYITNSIDGTKLEQHSSDSSNCISSTDNSNSSSSTSNGSDSSAISKSSDSSYGSALDINTFWELNDYHPGDKATTTTKQKRKNSGSNGDSNYRRSTGAKLSSLPITKRRSKRRLSSKPPLFYKDKEPNYRTYRKLFDSFVEKMRGSPENSFKDEEFFITR